tara:strand:+ start:123 stop:575 length:453 start_codon:yes stop_codon:yes gene_type:complete
MDNIRVDLPSGNWWEIKSDITRADKRHIDNLVSELAFDTMDKLEKRGLSVDKLSGLSSPDTSGPRKWGNEEEEAYLVRCSTAWSWDSEISSESIGERSNKDVERVIAKMRDLYIEDDDKEGKSLSDESLSSLNHVNQLLDDTEMQSKRLV